MLDQDIESLEPLVTTARFALILDTTPEALRVRLHRDRRAMQSGHAPEFPPPIRVSGREYLWRPADVRAWLDALPPAWEPPTVRRGPGRPRKRPAP